MNFLNHSQNSLQIIVFQTQFFMILTKNTTKPFPEIPGNRETISGNETPEISREFPPGNSREASLSFTDEVFSKDNENESSSLLKKI